MYKPASIGYAIKHTYSLATQVAADNEHSTHYLRHTPQWVTSLNHRTSWYTYHANLPDPYKCSSATDYTLDLSDLLHTYAVLTPIDADTVHLHDQYRQAHLPLTQLQHHLSHPDSIKWVPYISPNQISELHTHFNTDPSTFTSLLITDSVLSHLHLIPGQDITSALTVLFSKNESTLYITDGTIQVPLHELLANTPATTPRMSIPLIAHLLKDICLTGLTTFLSQPNAPQCTIEAFNLSYQIPRQVLACAPLPLIAPNTLPSSRKPVPIDPDILEAYTNYHHATDKLQTALPLVSSLLMQLPPHLTASLPYLEYFYPTTFAAFTQLDNDRKLAQTNFLSHLDPDTTSLEFTNYGTIFTGSDSSAPALHYQDPHFLDRLSHQESEPAYTLDYNHFQDLLYYTYYMSDNHCIATKDWNRFLMVGTKDQGHRIFDGTHEGDFISALARHLPPKPTPEQIVSAAVILFDQAYTHGIPSICPECQTNTISHSRTATLSI